MEIIKVCDFDYSIIDKAKRVKRPRGVKNKRNYLDLWCAFDIETTNRDNIDSFMYVWAFQVDEICTVIGRTWEEYLSFISTIKEHSKGAYICCHTHNLSYEFQFLRGIYEFTEDEVFCMDSRKILKCEMMEVIEYRCSYLHSNMKLKDYAERWSEHQKESGEEFDYSKIRYPWTKLTKNEIKYIQMDVLALVEAVKSQAKYDNHNIYNFPLTSTGYVRAEYKRRAREIPKIVITKCLAPEEILVPGHRVFRGGNTHQNRLYSGVIIEGAYSKDIASSYPWQMVNEDGYPMGAWYIFKDPRSLTVDNLCEDINLNFFGLIKVRLWDVKLSDPLWGCPYIARHKCDSIAGGFYDNGRVLSAEMIECYLTTTDLEIILSEYTFSDIEILFYANSKGGKLPGVLRDYILELFDAKTRLKGVDPLDYSLSKERLNSLFGMSVQSILKPDIKFQNGDYTMIPVDLKTRITKNNAKAWQSYMWGVATTGFARRQLELALQVVGSDMLYCDTDSVKYKGDHESGMERLNKIIRNKAEKIGAYAYDVNGVRHYMGVFEDEKPYKRFVGLHSKCYAYEYYDDTYGATISGVNKEFGAEELFQNGGLEAFKEGFTFYKAGGTDAIYNDKYYKELNIDGHKLIIRDNVVLKESTYTIGMTGEYKYLLEHPNVWRDVMKEYQPFSKLDG